MLPPRKREEEGETFPGRVEKQKEKGWPLNWSLGASPVVLIVGLLIWAGAGYISYLNWKRSGRRKVVKRLETLQFY